MNHYDFPSEFRAVYDRAVEKYAAGHRSTDNFLSVDDVTFLAANGISVQNLFDYAEDKNNYGEPTFELALSIELIRRDYFLNVQKGVASKTVVDEASLPGKAVAVKGIEWLPRLLPKTKAKLRGELPSSLMFSCGGDRRFFKTHDILPQEFLTQVWRHFENDAAVIDWVAGRSKAKA